MSRTLLVLAAGMGSRYGTDLKQLEAVDDKGHLLIHYSVWEAVKAGFTKIIFVIRREMKDAFIEKFSKSALNFLDDCDVLIDFVFQDVKNVPEWYVMNPDRVKPWGTVHAILCAEPLIQEPFFVINADDFYDTECFARASAMLASNPTTPALIAYWLHRTLPPKGKVNRGLCEVGTPLDYGLNRKYRNLEAITECRGLERGTDERGCAGAVCDGKFISGSTLVSMNTWILPKGIFATMAFAFNEFLLTIEDELNDEYILSDFMKQYLQAYKKGTQRYIPVATVSCDWYGITRKEDLEWVRRELDELTTQNPGIPKHIPF